MSMPEIVFEDKDLLVVNKPPELLCVPGLSHPDNLIDNIREHYPNVRLVHRLDMSTSGLVIFALNHSTQKSMGQQFEHRQISKRYTARVAGKIEEKEGDISMPLICDWPNRPKQMVDWEKGKHALTQYKVIDDGSNNDQETRLVLYPVTGRTHQLRVHCLAIGHPIIGDTLYAPEHKADRLMLHAEYIGFTHPTTGEQLNLLCPAPF